MYDQEVPVHVHPAPSKVQCTYNYTKYMYHELVHVQCTCTCTLSRGTCRFCISITEYPELLMATILLLVLAEILGVFLYLIYL